MARFLRGAVGSCLSKDCCAKCAKNTLDQRITVGPHIDGLACLSLRKALSNKSNPTAIQKAPMKDKQRRKKCPVEYDQDLSTFTKHQQKQGDIDEAGWLGPRAQTSG